ncbi:MAG TPA: D-glycero-beta-D-manno-heptose 1-phosphate adenylyltransferase [Arachidicoccus soli]|uniref:D-glycero-beta-D-manno-heptose 1-phosphate adenylyltransferase n=1 Tax=Arachidicoccus soli TaxID=2341117 RepID=A0A386HMX7_9BACT|nr:D-glycero-beta-D-manno-heptose 1-phosphate adenylyltransferase [Arachidicoccus soli]AYD46880.1 D-glycero-beta-D-manno-heptose 1-phosphate adenylyltransferase [Arachidicoccus soli]HEU0228524.1 D-glycero-beta-D-manno-heptose 1-phosphate adenylyltransferase [Arachidicoccus soli]
MKNIDFAAKKIYSLEKMAQIVSTWKLKSKTFAFTNGCFDILHAGHILSINDAAKTADYLIVAINSDQSVKRLKGEKRPINNEQDRASLLANLLVVDAVVIFEEDTPLKTISALLPDVLVKGGDYTIEQIVGAKEVLANGGNVIINPILEGYSTTNTIQKIKS